MNGRNGRNGKEPPNSEREPTRRRWDGVGWGGWNETEKEATPTKKRKIKEKKKGEEALTENVGAW